MCWCGCAESKHAFKENRVNKNKSGPRTQTPQSYEQSHDSMITFSKGGIYIDVVVASQWLASYLSWQREKRAFRSFDRSNALQYSGWLARFALLNCHDMHIPAVGRSRALPILVLSLLDGLFVIVCLFVCLCICSFVCLFVVPHSRECKSAGGCGDQLDAILHMP